MKSINKVLLVAALVAGVYASPSQAQTLANRWSFDGNLLDTSGNGNNGTLSGSGSFYTNGAFSGHQGIYLTTANLISTASAVGLPTAGNADWSMNLWLYLTNTPISLAYMAGFAATATASGNPVNGTARGLLAYGAPSNLGIYLWGKSYDLASGAPYPLNQWVMVTIVHNGSANTTSFYTNGVNIMTGAETALVTVPSPYNQYIQVGYPGSGYTYAAGGFKGIIDEFTIWSGALNAAQIAGLYQTNGLAWAPPIIVTQPSPITQYATVSASMSVVVGNIGPATNSYQWQQSSTNLLGQTNATIAFAALDPTNGGSYQVIVTNIYGSVTSLPPTLVTVLPLTPFIASTSTPATQYVGEYAYWSVTAGPAVPGLSFTYQWQQNGANLLGQTKATIGFAPLAAANVGSYSVIVSNAYGSVTSSTLVTVLPVTNINTALAAYWNFDEPNGLVVNDVSGNTNNGKMFNFVGDGSERVQGVTGPYALHFRGTNYQDYIQITNCNIRPPVTMSIAGWVSIDAGVNYANPTWYSIVKNWDGVAANQQVHFGLYSTAGENSCYVETPTGTQIGPASETTAMPQNQWVHVAFTADGTNLHIYRNGVLSGTPLAYGGRLNTNLATNAGLANTMGIGVKLTSAGLPYYTSSPGFWTGSMDDLAIWARALTPAEVNSIYLAGEVGQPLTNASAYFFLTACTAAQNVYAGQSAVFSVASSFYSAPPAYQWQVTDGVSTTNNLTNGLTFSGSTIFGATTATLTVSNVSSADAGSYYTCLVTTPAPSALNSPLAPLTLLVSTGMLITQPGDSITDFYNAIGTADPYPSGLGAADISDGTLAPYLNYGAYGLNAWFSGPVGYVVTPSMGGSVVTAARIYTSTNAQPDDPADFTLYGSNDGVTWSLITTTPLALPLARNASSGTINSNNQVLQEIDFPNTNGYYQYAVYFTNIVGGAAAYMGLEFAEVQLLGVQSPQAPEILVQPSPAFQDLQLGGSMTWSIVAAGAGSLTYQWYEGSTANPVLGTAASFTLASVTTNMSGVYFCVVSNAYGGTVSSSVSLSVLAPTSPYVSTVMADNPVAFYRLDEGPDNYLGNNGVIAHDSAGGHDGVYTNVYLWVAGYSAYDSDDYAADFGVYRTPNSYVGQINGIDFSSPATTPANFSVEAWVNLAANGTAGAGIVAKANSSGQQFALDTGGTANAFRFYIYNAAVSAAFQANPSVAPSLNTWYHLVGVLNESANAIYLYTNGVQAAKTTVTANSGVRTLAGPLSIGSRPGSSGYNMQVNGRIANVALYNYALTAAQVTNHYAATPKPPLVVSLVPTVPGLQSGFTAAGDPSDAAYDREQICTYNNSYSFVDTGPVTYTVTYGYVPPANGSCFGAIGFDQSGVNPVADWTDPTILQIRVVPIGAAGTAVILELKTNSPNANFQGNVSWVTPSPTVGTWSFTISNNVNIYCVAPNGSSTVLPFPMGFQTADVEGNFPSGNGMYIYVGAQSGGVGDEGSQWVIKNFSITNNGVATLVEDFAAEANAGDPGPVPGAQYIPWIPILSGVPWRDTAYSANDSGYPVNPKGVFLISTNTPYYLDWNTVQGSGMHVMTNTTTFSSAGWGTNTFLTTNAYLFATFYRTELTNLPPSQAVFFELKK